MVLNYFLVGCPCYKLGYSFINLLLTSCNQDNSTNFFAVKKMYNEAVRGVYYLRIREKLHGTIRNDNFQRITSLQHIVAKMFRNIVPTLQRSVA